MDVLAWIWMVIRLFLILVLIKNYLLYKELASIKKVSFKFAFAPLLILCTAYPLILSLPICLILHRMISLILLYKHGSKYWGLLNGRDAVFNLENKNPVHILFIIKYPNNRSQNFYDAVKEAAYKVLKLDTNSRLFGAFRTFLGYPYIMKNEVTLEDCFRKLQTMNVPIRRDNLIEVMGDYTSVPLPKNREALWDMFVGTQPVQWTDDSEDKEAEYYPVLFRMNHTFTDFGHLINGIVQLFADKNVQFGCAAHVYQIQKPCLPQKQSLVLLLKEYFVFLSKRLKFYTREFYLMLMAPSVFLVNALLMMNNANILNGPKLAQSKHLLTRFDLSPFHMEMVKRIKKKIPNCTFEDIGLTAIAASLKDFFKKSSAPIPEYVTAEIPSVPSSFIKPEKPKVGETICRNKLTFSTYRLPVNFSANKQKPLTSLLKQIKSERNLIKNSLEQEVNYFILRVLFSYLTALLVCPLMDSVHNCTMFIANIPGPHLITVLGGCPVQDICIWPATRGKTGIGVVIATYDGRMQLSLNVDKALVSDRNKVQDLMDGFFKHLHLLAEETF